MSFLIWLVAALTAFIVDTKSRSPLLVGAVALAIVAVFGVRSGDLAGPRITVAAVQSGSPATCADLTLQIGSRARFIVWPELIMEPHNEAPDDAARSSGACVIAVTRALIVKAL